jgi:aryl-alcohol dehydrogenase-like predicted oxidoreductase
VIGKLDISTGADTGMAAVCAAAEGTLACALRFHRSKRTAMQRRPLGRTGMTVPSICLGTMTWGNQNTQEEAFAQMDLAMERGIDFFDTAEMYAIPPSAETYGKTEIIIGNWLKARGLRNKVILATKIAGRAPMTWARPEGGLNNGFTRHTKKQIDIAVQQSLARLQTDYLDLYQLHWPDRAYAGFGFHVYRDYPQDWEAFEAILDALAPYVRKGVIRAVGVSNESPWGVMRFLKAADERGLPRIASIQNAYNLVNRVFEYGNAEICLREDVSLLAYSPLGQGYLTGKYRNGARPPGARRTLFDRLQRYEGPGAEAAINAYLDYAETIAASPAHLALKFVETRPFVTSVIIGATSMDQLRHDLDGFALSWTDDMERAVNALHLAHRSPCP